MARKYLQRMCALCVGATTLIGSVTLSASMSVAAPSHTPTSSSTYMNSQPETTIFSAINAKTPRNSLFDSNWRFLRSDAVDASSPSFDDSSWKTINLPHDYSINQPYSASNEAESGYLPGGTGWYRKSFVIDKDTAGKHIRVNFDGVYMNATVWFNGHKLGTHPYGYSAFTFDLTPYINFGGQNTLVVRADNIIPSSRWYSGSGIFRPVHLIVTDGVHVAHNGVDVQTPELEKHYRGSVDVHIKTLMKNETSKPASVSITQTVFDKDPKNPLGTHTQTAQISAHSQVDVNSLLEVQHPQLWSTDNPHLYTVRTSVTRDGKVIDTSDTTYGFRWTHFDPATGFSLNGVHMKLRGVSMHHDQGALGSVANQAAMNRQLRILKDMGVNAIRTTHNPPAKGLVEAANRMGIMLIEEAFDMWIKSKNGNVNDYGHWFNQPIEKGNAIEGGVKGDTWSHFDISAMVRRDINDPSVIMWSLGNEMMEGITGSVAQYPAVAQKLIDWVKKEDTSRPVTLGDNKLKRGLSQSVAIASEIAQAGGAVGTNYSNGASYDQLHSAHPTWPLYGSETASAINSRGIYNRYQGGSRTPDKELTSYDNSAVGWGYTASQSLYEVITRDFVQGQFVWTGFDYIGEPTPWNGISAGAQGTWPSPKNSYFGIIDTAGLPKDSYYLYRAQWNRHSHTLHMLPAWNSDVVYKDSSGKVPVVVYTDAPSVELFFTPANGGKRVSLGKKTFTQHTTPEGYHYQLYEGPGKSSIQDKNLYLTWNVPFKPGTLTAVAYDAKGQVMSDTVGRSHVTTTGSPAKLQASADRSTIKADGEDLSYITMKVTDANGNVVPHASNRVKVSVTGPGKLVGMDNGDSPDHESYQAKDRKAFSGELIAIVQSTSQPGTIHVNASAEGLQSAQVNLTSQATGDASHQREPYSTVYSHHYYVKASVAPKLPHTLPITYTDGTTSDQPVTWSPIKATQLDHTNTFQVTGQVASHAIVATVTVVKDVVAVLNYSATTQLGHSVQLPSERPIVAHDSTVSADSSLPVTWKMPDSSAYAHAGIIHIQGTARAFDKNLPVEATIRVQKEDVTRGDNLAPQAMRVTPYPSSVKQTGSIKLLTDGVTTAQATQPQTYWVATGNSPSVVFEYATQQRFTEVSIAHLADATSSASSTSTSVSTSASTNTGTHASGDRAANTPPQASPLTKPQIFVSDDGTNYTPVKLTSKPSVVKDGVQTDTYAFEPLTATFVKLVFPGSTTPRLSEVMLYQAKGAYSTYTSAKLSSVTVDGKALDSTVMEKRMYTARSANPKVSATSDKNASITILPPDKNKIVIISESEDHQARSFFTILLDKGQGASASSSASKPSAASSSAGSSTGASHASSSSVSSSVKAPGHHARAASKGAQLSSWLAHTGTAAGILGACALAALIVGGIILGLRRRFHS